MDKVKSSQARVASVSVQLWCRRLARAIVLPAPLVGFGLRLEMCGPGWSCLRLRGECDGAFGRRWGWRGSSEGRLSHSYGPLSDLHRVNEFCIGVSE